MPVLGPRRSWYSGSCLDPPTAGWHSATSACLCQQNVEFMLSPCLGKKGALSSLALCSFSPLLGPEDVTRWVFLIALAPQTSHLVFRIWSMTDLFYRFNTCLVLETSLIPGGPGLCPELNTPTALCHKSGPFPHLQGYLFLFLVCWCCF